MPNTRWYKAGLPDLNSVQFKAAQEAVVSKWIIEIAEFSAYKKGDIDRIKEFITTRSDDFRAAYDRGLISS